MIYLCLLEGDNFPQSRSYLEGKGHEVTDPYIKIVSQIIWRISNPAMGMDINVYHHRFKQRDNLQFKNPQMGFKGLSEIGRFTQTERLQRVPRLGRNTDTRLAEWNVSFIGPEKIYI
jgi:hypothetical protein